MHLCTPIPSEYHAGFWTECWWHAGRSPSSLTRRARRPWFPTRMSNLDSSDHRKCFHFKTVHFKWALAHRTRQRFWTMFTFGFLFAWQSFSCICRLYSGLCSPTVVFGSIPGPYVNDRIMPMSDAVSSKGPKTTGIQQRSSALSLTHRYFSSFSESFDDVMHCRWWDLQSLCNLTLRNVVFKVFHNLFTSGGPLSALTCCVNARLLSAIKKISPLIYSQSWVGSWVYTTHYDDFHPDILARMYT